MEEEEEEEVEDVLGSVAGMGCSSSLAGAGNSCFTFSFTTSTSFFSATFSRDA